MFLTENLVEKLLYAMLTWTHKAYGPLYAEAREHKG